MSKNELMIVNNYEIIQMEQNELLEVIEENLGGDMISLSDLTRVKCPGVGMKAFMIDDEPQKEVTGIIVNFQKRRGLWEEKYTGSNANPPICQSFDGINGRGYTLSDGEEKERNCTDCPMAKFVDGQAPLCRETSQIFLLQEDSLLPITVNVPPTSLREFRQYRTRLAARNMSYYAVVTKISLEESTTKNGSKVNRYKFQMVEKLDKEQKNKVRQYVQAMKPILQHAEVETEDFE